MEHPFSVLQPEYTALLAACRVTRPNEVFQAATKVRAAMARYGAAAALTGAPALFIGALDYRESDCNPDCGLGQGDPWNEVSTHVPKGCGPFRSWADAALFYWHYDHMAAPSWTMPVVCFKGEAWNGFGPRDHGRRTGYLWSGTNIYDDGPGGKYTADGHWNPNTKDDQIGIIPIILQLAEWLPSMAVAGMPPQTTPTVTPHITSTPIGVRNAEWIQRSLNQLGADPPLKVDGSYGRMTARAVRIFQTTHRLRADGFAGPQTLAAITVALGG